MKAAPARAPLPWLRFTAIRYRSALPCRSGRRSGGARGRAGGVRSAAGVVDAAGSAMVAAACGNSRSILAGHTGRSGLARPTRPVAALAALIGARQLPGDFAPLDFVEVGFWFARPSRCRSGTLFRRRTGWLLGGTRGCGVLVFGRPTLRPMGRSEGLCRRFGSLVEPWLCCAVAFFRWRRAAGRTRRWTLLVGRGGRVSGSLCRRLRMTGGRRRVAGLCLLPRCSRCGFALRVRLPGMGPLSDGLAGGGRTRFGIRLGRTGVYVVPVEPAVVGWRLSGAAASPVLERPAAPVSLEVVVPALDRVVCCSVVIDLIWAGTGAATTCGGSASEWSRGFRAPGPGLDRVYRKRPPTLHAADRAGFIRVFCDAVRSTRADLMFEVNSLRGNEDPFLLDGSGCALAVRGRGPAPRDLALATTRRGALSGGSGRQPTNCFERRHSTQAGAQSVPATQTQPLSGSSYHRP